MTKDIEKCECENSSCNDECTCEQNCTCGEQSDKHCTCDEHKKSEEDNKKCDCNHEEKDKKCIKEKKDKHKNKKDEIIKELEQKLKEEQEKSLREKAEAINFRKRKEEEVSRMLKYANEDLINELLTIIDHFESAIKMDDNNLDDEVSKFLSGFKMTYANLISILEKFGVKAIDGANKPFDPAFHQAVMTEKSDLEPGMVIEVLRKGYLLKDKVLRPAMVKVSE